MKKETVKKLLAALESEPWTLTPKQYYAARIQYMVKNYGVTAKQAMELYPPESIIGGEYYLENWDKWIHHTGGLKIRIPDKVLDRVTDLARYRALHNYPDLYSDYIPPEIRKMNRQAPRIYSRARVAR